MRRFATAAISLFFVSLSALHVFAEEKRPRFPPDETLNIPSLTLTDEQFLRGQKANGVVVTLTGQLRFPNWNERLPVVVLLHGSDGVDSNSALQWREFLNKMGIVTFRLDSFGGRGVDQVESDPSRLGFFTQVYDTYRAIEVLAAHARIDPSRIAVMGFSRGGSAALYTSMRRFQNLYGSPQGHIAAHLSFYPACNLELVDELDVSSAPIREFHGSADNWTLAAPCRDYITRLSAAGKDAIMTEYPGVYHAFDNPNARSGSVIQGAQTTRNCQRREEKGTMINVATGKPFSYKDTCVELGPTLGYDKTATEASQAAVKELLTGVFRLD